ncbi:acyltransferase [Rhizobium sp. RU33A]|uniref:acyltransferase family protein n=1 Tax=Rhizobium sp. RU33A TaxID=1907413 RepID=UPI0009F994BF|nr:acyltransferase [Rhizobium sp. RU33A]
MQSPSQQIVPLQSYGVNPTRTASITGDLEGHLLPSSQLVYNPALDGTRAVAVITVIAFHCRVPGFSGGMIGVDVFFVLSGYLITSILRSELSTTGDISLRRFYYKRMLRLWPPLILFLLACGLSFPYVFPEANPALETILPLLYLSDYSVAFWREPLINSHTWSLSVEEHFYLIWPLLLLITRRLPTMILIRCLFGLFVAGSLWRIIDGLIWEDWFRTYFRFDTRFTGLVAGSIIALNTWKPSEEKIVKILIASTYTLLLLLLILRVRNIDSVIWGGIVADIAASGLIFSLTSGVPTGISKTLSHPVLVYIGTISYSVYLWHYPIAKYVRDDMTPITAFLVSATLSIAIAAVSYWLMEKKLKRLRHRST